MLVEKTEDIAFNALSAELQTKTGIDPRLCLRVGSLPVDEVDEQGRVPLDKFFPIYQKAYG